MYAGRPVEVGTVDQIFYRPSMPYTHGLLGSLPRLDGDGAERLRQIPGSPPSIVGSMTGCPFAPAVPDASRDLRHRGAQLLPVAGDPAPAAVAAPIPGDSEPEIVLVPSTGHVAACHFSEQVAGMPIASMFPDSAADHEGVG